MYKYFFFTILFLFPSFLFGQFTDEDTYWIATESRQLKDQGIYPMDGTIMRFTEDSLYMQHIFHDSIMVFNPKVTPKKIRLDGKRWGKIKHWNNDSLVLVFDRWMLVKFVPVSSGVCESSELVFWEYGDYTGKSHYWDFDLKLLDVPWVLYPDNIAKECIVQVGDRRYKYSELEKWSIVELDNDHIFSITFGQFEPQIFLVTEYQDDTAFVKLLGKDEIQGLYLAKKPRLPINEQLTSSRWRSKEVLDYAHSFDNDTIWDGLEFIGFMPDTTLFRKETLLGNQLSYEFSEDGTYKIYQADEPLLAGEWLLLLSGEEIKVGDHSYIDIISLDENMMVIGKFDRFDVGYEEGREEGDYSLYYYKLKLGL